jgi:hypothetical protein
MCNSVTMCNGSKSHKPFSINNCNGVTGVAHLSWVPPMTRMGRLRLCGGLRFKANPTHPCHPWYPWSDAAPPLPRVAPAASATLGKGPKLGPPPAHAQNQAEKALLVLATSGGRRKGCGKYRGDVRAAVAPQASLCAARRGRALRTTPLCRGAVSSCDKGAAGTGTRCRG